MKNRIFQQPLASPIVAIASPDDGLLRTADLNAPVPVSISLWTAVEPNFYFQLTLDGKPASNKITITAADITAGSITTFLKEDLLLKEGTYRLGYVASRPNTEFSTSSLELTLRVDRTPPGAALLAPMILPGASFGDQLIGLLPGYAGLEEGDIIQTLCNKTHGPLHVVQADELTLRPIEITFKREFLESLGTENVTIEYFVIDRAGNESIISLPVELFLQL